MASFETTIPFLWLKIRKKWGVDSWEMKPTPLVEEKASIYCSISTKASSKWNIRFLHLIASEVFGRYFVLISNLFYTFQSLALNSTFVSIVVNKFLCMQSIGSSILRGFKGEVVKLDCKVPIWLQSFACCKKSFKAFVSSLFWLSSWTRL